MRELRIARAKAGMTLMELEAASGVGASNISKIERGVVSPQVATLRKLADALGVDIAEFIEEPELAGKGSAPREAGPSLLEKALNAARLDEEKTARAINRLAASEGVLPGTNVAEHEEDKVRAELRTRGFPDEYFESFIWPLVVEAARVESLEQALAACEEERRREMAQNR